MKDAEEGERRVVEEIFGQFADPEAKKRWGKDVEEAVAVRLWLLALTSPEYTITGGHAFTVGLVEDKSAMVGAVECVSGKIFSWQELKDLTEESLTSAYYGLYGVEAAAGRTLLLSAVRNLMDETQLLRALHRVLIEPIEEFLVEDEDVLVIPHQHLFTVPWPALIDRCSPEYPKGRYLIEKHAVRVCPSLRIASLATRRRTASPQNPAGKCACIVGNPLPLPSGEKPLPHAEGEANDVFIRLSKPGLFTKGVKLARAEEATRDHVVKEMLDGADWVHLACHADLEQSAILLAGEDSASGALTALEVQQNVKLADGATVVLSACNSGMGKIKSEGVIGLSRAFLVAGASAVVVSLWSVDDTSTTKLMKLTYEHLEKGLTVPHAMRAAMLVMLRNEEGGEGEEGTSRKTNNVQGQYELKALSLVFNDGKVLMFKKKPLAEDNGILRGFLTPEALSTFGGKRYTHLWGDTGTFVEKAKSLPDKKLKDVKAASAWIQKAIRTRQKCRFSDAKCTEDPLKVDERLKARDEHDFLIQVLLESVAAVESHIRVREAAIEKVRVAARAPPPPTSTSATVLRDGEATLSLLNNYIRPDSAPDHARNVARMGSIVARMGSIVEANLKDMEALVQRASAPVDVSEEATLARLLDLHTKLSDTLAAFRALGPPAGGGGTVPGGGTVVAQASDVTGAWGVAPPPPPELAGGAEGALAAEARQEAAIEAELAREAKALAEAAERTAATKAKRAEELAEKVADAAVEKADIEAKRVEEAKKLTEDRAQKAATKAKKDEDAQALAEAAERTAATKAANKVAREAKKFAEATVEKAAMEAKRVEEAEAEAKDREARDLDLAQERLGSLSFSDSEDSDDAGEQFCPRGGSMGASHAPRERRNRKEERAFEARRPYYWAGFIVSGATTSLPSKVGTTTSLPPKEEAPILSQKFEEWSVEKVSGLLKSFGPAFANAAAAVEEGGVNGATFLDFAGAAFLDGGAAGEELTDAPPDGLGISKLQLGRVRNEVKKACL